VKPPTIIARGVDHHTLHGISDVIPRAFCHLAVVVLAHGNRTGIGVHQQLIAVVTQPLLRPKRTAHPVTVKLPLLETRHEHMPVIEGAVAHRIKGDNVSRFGIVVTIK